jgi:hypothetical protein
LALIIVSAIGQKNKGQKKMPLLSLIFFVRRLRVAETMIKAAQRFIARTAHQEFDAGAIQDK